METVFDVSSTEVAVNYSGHVSVISGRCDVPAQLVKYGRSFLLTNRETVRFLYWHDNLLLTVRLDRQENKIDGRATTVLSFSPTRLPQGITRREVDVLTLNAVSLSNAEIALRLGTRPRTVSTQIERLLHKLEQPGRAGLAALAVDSNLIVLPIPGGTKNVTGIGPVSVQQFSEAMDPERLFLTILQELTPQKRPFIIGTLAPLTGIASADGEELVRGSAMAVREINEQGGLAGRRLDHVVIDADMFDADRVRAGFDELFELEVDAITTNYVTAENPFAMNLVADYQRPFLHTATFNKQVDLVARDPGRYGMVFQTCPSEQYYAAGFVRFLTEIEQSTSWRPATKSVLPVVAASDSTRIDQGTFRADLIKRGWTPMDTISVTVARSEWNAAARRVVEAAPAVVMVAHFVPEHIAEFQQVLNDLDFKGLVHYVYGASIPKFKQELGPGADGVTWSTVTSRYDDALSEAFHRDYILRYGVEPGPSQASAAYDQVKLLSQAWAEIGSADPLKTARALRTQAHRGLNGIYYFGAPGQAAQCYPDGTDDSSLGQALMTYQFQGGTSVALSPAGLGDIRRFMPPPT